MLIRVLSVAVIAAFACLGSAEDKKAERPKPKPESTPLEITITGKTTKYTLDTGGLSSADYKKKLEAVKGVHNPPDIDLTLEIKNTSDKTVDVWIGGGGGSISLELKGKGAYNAQPQIAFNTQAIEPIGCKIEPGKTHTVPLTSLASGYRGQSHVAYWTEAGEYELVATLNGSMLPPPKGSEIGGDAKRGRVSVSSPAFKITVEEKK